MDNYRVATDEEKGELEICDEYDVLIGPDEFECILGEPEDRSWYRGGSNAVDELNRLYDMVQMLNNKLLAIVGENKHDSK